MNITDQFLQEKKETWFKEWFDTAFYHQLYGHRNEREAAVFVDALLAELQPEPGASMLDLGCGAGRHSRQLASHGYRVTGLDLSTASIAAAKQLATPGAQFYRHDMRLPFGRSRFHYVFNFFTSFGYFDSNLENNAVVSNISNALRHGGMLVMDYLNVSYSEDHLASDEQKEIDGVIYHIRRRSDSTHFYKTIMVNELEYTERVEKLRLAHFDILFKKNGLRLQKVFGDYRLGKYNVDLSPRLIMVAEKM